MQKAETKKQAPAKKAVPIPAENETEKAARMALIVARLKEVYPDAVCALESGGDPWRLLVMGMLSAQCTDARVNLTCRDLFRVFPDAASLAAAPQEEIEELIRPCGLYHTKAKNIRDASRMLLDEYGGTLPTEMDDLLRFPGIGRKIANLLRGDIFHLPAVVTDTHCIRICGRLGMYEESLRDPLRIEKILVPLIAPGESADFCHRIVQFGRDTCTARAPKCGGCPLSGLCPHGTPETETK